MNLNLFTHLIKKIIHMETTIPHTTKSGIHNWWMTLLLGIFFLLFGIWMLSTPVTSYIALASAFSILMFASGINEIYFAVAYRSQYTGWGWYLTGGILDLIIGLVLIIYPSLSLAVLPFFVGFWLMFRGIVAMASAIELRDYANGAWGWLMLLGIITVFFSFFILSNPLFASISVVIMTSFSFITMGIYNILLAFRFRKTHRFEKKYKIP